MIDSVEKKPTNLLIEFSEKTHKENLPFFLWHIGRDSPIFFVACR